MMAKSRYIPLPVRCLLWGRSAGRCEFKGCNMPVTYHPKTKESVNLAEAAHIIGFSEDGPRGEEELSELLAKDVDNLMMLCKTCHKTIDAKKENYPIDHLRRMKRTHEARIEIVTSIGQNRESHMLLYGANVGDQSSLVSYQTTAPALIAEGRFPATQNPLELSLINSSFKDAKGQFWQIEENQLRTMIERQIRPLLAQGNLQHLSIFALAPQPLLMLLGYLLCDINYETQVYQLHREPPGWSWQEHPDNFSYTVTKPSEIKGPPVLVLALSATITDDRITDVLGSDVSIWRMTIDEPNNDFLKSKEQLQQFRQIIRPLLNEIKAKHGQKTLLSVFPAMPVSVAVDFGRIIMPKADMPLRIYDQNNDLGGFVPALDIGSLIKE